MVDNIRTELKSQVQGSLGQTAEQNRNLKDRVFYFGVISIGIMLVSTFLQVKYLKNFFRYKKII